MAPRHPLTSHINIGEDLEKMWTSGTLQKKTSMGGGLSISGVDNVEDSGRTILEIPAGTDSSESPASSISQPGSPVDPRPLPPQALSCDKPPQESTPLSGVRQASISLAGSRSPNISSYSASRPNGASGSSTADSSSTTVNNTNSPVNRAARTSSTASPGRGKEATKTTSTTRDTTTTGTPSIANTATTSTNTAADSSSQRYEPSPHDAGDDPDSETLVSQHYHSRSPSNSRSSPGDPPRSLSLSRL